MEKQKLDELRRRAKERLESERDDSPENAGDDVRKLLHELRTYQIELELQNDDLRRVQEELVETRDQYIDLYDFAPFGYLTLNEKGVIVKANLTLADLLGEERGALHGQSFTRFIFYNDQDRFYKHFRAFTASMDRLVFDLRMQPKDGDWFWAKLECVPRTKSEMSGIHIRIALHDITDAKRLENEIIKTKKLEATALLAGGIAHDFNNLLAVIIGNLEVAQEDLLKGLPVADKLQDAHNACLHAAELTKKFLTFSSGGVPLITSVPVETLVTDAVSLALAGSNVDFECSFPDDLWPVAVDIGQMTQAIGNVVTNAREAMLQGGLIRIRAENVDSIPENLEVLNNREAKLVKVSIQDQGVGIPWEVLTQVFDPYFTSKDLWNKKGLGLGLTVTYSILKKHGGAIDIASRPDAGTTVSMYLPARDRQIIDTRETRPRKAPASNKKILFMDDEEMLRNVTRSMLENLGYEVETVCNGEEAIKLYTDAKEAGEPFGAVILDLTIKGGLGGRETIKKLREFDPDIRAIVASGYSNDPVMANFREYGFLDALNKPYQLQDLEKSLEGIGDAAKDR
ncbi:MAG: response regulator [Desulfobulbaceae bacterium]|nr:response regulator [Desulfobulbaceae bacterium]